MYFTLFPIVNSTFFYWLLLYLWYIIFWKQLCIVYPKHYSTNSNNNPCFFIKPFKTQLLQSCFHIKVKCIKSTEVAEHINWSI